jgi:uncharacterized membrane protein YdjX (TVP38/TMEM64 family)
MSASSPSGNRWRVLARRLLPLAGVLVFAFVAYLAVGDSGISLESLVHHREIIDAFITDHRILSVVAFLGIYIVTVAFSLPGATFLTVAGGFLFGFATGAITAAIGATVGATLIFLVARTALGEPLLRRAGPRARQVAKGFRDDAFSYLLFLRLVPVFPFFLVNLVPAFAGVRLGPFVAATAIGVIPAVVVFTMAGMGLDSVMTAQKNVYYQCMASGGQPCRMVFEPADVLTPQMIMALIGLGLLALLPVFVKRLRARSRAVT